MTGLLNRIGAAGRSYADVARSPSYFPLWVSQLVSSFGDTLHYSALVVLVFDLGALLADAVGIQPVFWLGGILLCLAGTAGLRLFAGYDFQYADVAQNELKAPT